MRLIGACFRFPGVILFSWFLSLLLLLPSLQAPYALDDYHLISKIEQNQTSPLDLYVLAQPNDPDYDNQLKLGIRPWWSYPGLQITFFRPLSSFLFYADYQLFGNNSTPSHVHSFLWLGALLWAFGLLYRRLLPGPLGVLALVLCALDDSHGFASFWLANRNSLVAAVPVFWAMLAHIRWREEGWVSGLYLSIVGYIVGLLGGEMALSAMAYVVAYELFAGPGTVKARLKSLFPLTIIGVGYLALYRGFGYGTVGSDLYTHPTMHFSEYLIGVLSRIPILLGDLLMGVLADLSFGAPEIQRIQVIAGLIGLLVVGYLARGSIARLAMKERRAILCLSAGALFSLVPTAATLPQNRLLLCAAFGAAALVALLLCDAWSAFRNVIQISRLQRRILLAFSCWLIMAHIVIAPSMQVLIQTLWNHQEEVASKAILEINKAEHLAGRDVIILASPLDPRFLGFYTHALWSYHEMPSPHSWKLLSATSHDYTITRIGPQALLLETVEGHLFHNWLETIFRSGDLCLTNNESVDVGALRATVVACDEIGPTKIRFEFATSLDEKSLLFLSWQEGKLRPQKPPNIGESITFQSIGPL